MNIRTAASICRISAIASAFVLVVPFSGAAADDALPQALNVKVLPDRYVAAGRTFTTVAALQAWADPARIRTLSLDTCGAASTGQLLAAVERLQSAYAEGIRIRALRAGEAECASASGGPSGGSGVASDDGYLATDEFGRSKLP